MPESHVWKTRGIEGGRERDVEGNWSGARKLKRVLHLKDQRFPELQKMGWGST